MTQIAKRPARGRILHDLRLDAIAAVDFPCQEPAMAAILKRAPADGSDLGPGFESFAKLAKLDDMGARAFAEILAENEARRAKWKADEVMWPLFDALRESLSSIAGDQTLDPATKLTRVQESVTQFITALREEWPDVAEEVAEIAKASPNADRMAVFIRAAKAANEEADMPDIKEADLTKAATELTSDNPVIKALIDAAIAKGKADAESAAAEKAKAMPFGDMEEEGKPTKKGRDFLAKHSGDGDEILKIGTGEDTQTIRKSVVGDAQFAIFKAQNAEIEKARDRADMAEFEKRASDEFPSLPGTATEKALVLKALRSAPEAVRKTADELFKAGEAAAKGAFEPIGKGTQPGGGDGQGGGDLAKARGDFQAKVSEIAKRDNCGTAEAMSKARREHPELHKAAYPPEPDQDAA